MKLSERKRRPPKILLYGRPGTGKTAHVLTLGSGLRVIDLDDGVETGVSMKDVWRGSRLNVDVISCLEDDPSKGLAFPKAKKCIRIAVKQCREGRFPFQGICIDSFTALANAAVRHVQGNSGRIGQNPQLQEWGLAFIELQSLMVLLRSLPIAVVMTAHEYQLDKEDGIGRTIEIAIPGRKLPSQITGTFDEVWRYKIVGSGAKRVFTIQTQGSSAVLARSRFDLKDGINASEVSMVEVMRRCGYEWVEGEEDVKVEEVKKLIEKKKKEREREQSQTRN